MTNPFIRAVAFKPPPLPAPEKTVTISMPPEVAADVERLAGREGLCTERFITRLIAKELTRAQLAN